LLGLERGFLNIYLLVTHSKEAMGWKGEEQQIFTYLRVRIVGKIEYLLITCPELT